MSLRIDEPREREDVLPVTAPDPDAQVLAGAQHLLNVLDTVVRLVQPIVQLHTVLREEIAAVAALPALKTQVRLLAEELEGLETRRRRMAAADRQQRLRTVLPWATRPEAQDETSSDEGNAHE